jgi:exonuclease III
MNDTKSLDRLDILLFELQQREVKKFAVEQVIQLADNLTKIAIFGIKSSWVKEFKTKILAIQETKCSTKKEFLSKETYFNLLYTTFFDKKLIYKKIKNILKNLDYKKLQTPLRYQITEEDITLILFKIEKLMKTISMLLSKGEITHENLDELMNEYVKFWANERGIKKQF